MRAGAVGVARPVSRLTDEDLSEMTKYMPTGLRLGRWLQLHVWHMIAMEAQEYYAACKIADAKYALYLDDVRSVARGLATS